MSININDVLKASNTKWNFLDFKPGLVGGHCLPVNPYYFAEAAKRVNFKTKLAIAGRNVNQEMANYIANLIKQDIEKRKLPKDTTGVVITSIDADSPVKNLMINNIIVEAQKKKIKTPGDLQNIVKSSLVANNKTILVVIYNNENQISYIGIKLK